MLKNILMQNSESPERVLVTKQRAGEGIEARAWAVIRTGHSDESVL